MHPYPSSGDLPAKLAQPARRALAAAGLERLEQVSQWSEADIRKLHGIGQNAIQQLRQALAAKSLSFASDPKNEGKRG